MARSVAVRSQMVDIVLDNLGEIDWRSNIRGPMHTSCGMAKAAADAVAVANAVAAAGAVGDAALPPRASQIVSSMTVWCSKCSIGSAAATRSRNDGRMITTRLVTSPSQPVRRVQTACSQPIASSPRSLGDEFFGIFKNWRERS
jgi:hypothetical protein